MNDGGAPDAVRHGGEHRSVSMLSPRNLRLRAVKALQAIRPSTRHERPHTPFHVANVLSNSYRDLLFWTDQLEQGAESLALLAYTRDQHNNGASL